MKRFKLNPVSIFCVSMLVLSGCGTAPADDFKSYDLNSFDMVDLSSVEPEIISRTEMVMGMPFDMCMVSDSIVAFKDTRTESQLWLLNVNNGDFAQCLYRGNGPKECLYVTNIWSDDGVLFAGGAQDGKVMKITVNPDSLSGDAECISTMSDSFMKITALSDSQLLYAPLSKPEVRYLLACMDGTVTDTVGVFQTDKLEEGVAPNNALFQMQIALSPDKKHMVSSNMSWNRTEIYSVPFDGVMVLNGPMEIESKAVAVRTEFGTRFGQKPDWHMFAGVSACNDGFALGFIGRELKEREDYLKGVESVLFFDWNGNPTKMVRLDRDVFDFTVDFDNMAIYAIVIDPVPAVLKYSLPLSYDELMGR
ncbi:MAG: TolB-like 6-bladed beta-propeller domain-containing protein [Rikenellaceae bacterium]|nr:TolB-like 6-bladed beta-propeller domain-containing protein [Rikenellaceae bacterium]